MPVADEIEIRVNSVEQLFNSLDPAPFRERELDSKAERYIVSYAREVPAQLAVKLVVYLHGAASEPSGQ